MIKTIITIIFILITITGCATNDTDNHEFEIVVSTTMLGDLVKQIGQDHVHVTMLFGPGIDPHLAQPTGGDTRIIQNAKLVVFSGLNLETHFSQILNAYEGKTIQVGDMLDKGRLLFIDENEIDPHFWFSVPLWQEAARIVGDALKEADPSHATVYESNTVSYIETLNELNQWIETKVSELENHQKILVTAHDAFGYFASTYGFEVFAIAGLSTEGEVTTQNINLVADVIIENHVKSIFIESTVPQTTIDSVVAEVERRGSSVKVGNELYSDSLGSEIDSEYTNAIKHNVNSIVEGLK